MGRWRATASLLLNQYKKNSKNPIFLPNQSIPCCNCKASIFFTNPISRRFNFFNFRQFSALPSRVSSYYNDFESASLDLSPISYLIDSKEDEESGKIPVKAYFLCTSINLKSLQAENLINVVPATSRSANYIALRYCEFPSEVTALGVKEYVACRYMVVFQYGSAVLFNVEDHAVESYLDIVRRHASGLLPEMRKDDYAIKEKPLQVEDMLGGPDYIVLKTLDTDSIRIIGSVLGQSIALDYFVSQIDGMVEVFAGINRIMESTGTFTMDRTELLRLVGKANSNLADVILKVGLFERSEIAWREAKYAQIYEYLREEYEVNQRFGNLDFKLKFVEHNIHFLLEVIQNRKSHLLEWAIVFLLIVENGIAFYEIFFRD